MPRSRPLIASFSAGVLSPRLSARADSPQFQQALTQCENFVVTPQGGAVFRRGFERLRETGISDEYGRGIQFHRGGKENDLWLEVNTDGNAYVFNAHAQVGTLLDHLWDTQEQLDELYFHNTEKTGVIVQADHPPYYIETPPLVSAYTGTHIPFAQIPQAAFNDAKSPQDSGAEVTYTITFNGFSAENTYFITYNGVDAETNGPEPEAVTYYFSSTDSINQSAIHNALFRIPELVGGGTNVSLVSVVTPGSVYEVTISGFNAGKPLTLTPFNPSDTRFITVTQDRTLNEGNEPAWSYPFVVEHDSNYYQCIAPHVASADTEPGVGVDWATVWVDLGATEPAWYDYQHDTDGDGVGDEAWSLTDADSNDSVYAPWDRGFPEVVAFHQQRCVFMATKDAPTAVWASRIGEYQNFGRGVNADDAFYFDLATSDSPRIKWAESTQTALPIGTSSGDFLLSAEVTLGPTDFQATKQNGARSENSRAVVIGTEVYYIEQGREKLRSTSYVRDINAWQSRDVGLLAEHLMHAKVKRLAIMRTPELLVFGLREDGTLLGFTYIPGNPPSLAYWEFTSPGQIKDIWIQYEYAAGEDVLYISTTYDEGETHYIERMYYPRRKLDPILTQSAAETDSLVDNEIIYIDSWITDEISDEQYPPVDESFEGDTIRVIVDDAWVGDLVVTEGVVDLGEVYTGTMAYGYPYNGELKTFEMASGSPQGIALGTKRKWNRLFVRLLDSALPKINGWMNPDRTPTHPMDIAETVRLGLQDVEIRDSGWKDNDGSVTILQDRPYPTHVVGMFGEFNVGDT